MEQHIKNQITYGLRYVPPGIFKSFLMRDNADTEAFRKKAGGFLCGVCHPRENYAQIKAANIRWVRMDIPMPFNSEGEPNPSYLSFKERCRGYVEQGIRVMAITPYPHQFLSVGIDPRRDEEKVRETAAFLAEDLQPLVGALQVTNEMGIPHFTLPLTMDEAARFIGIQLEAIAAVKGELLIGYNSAGPQADLHVRMRPYFQYCDYVGIDIYIGCFAGAGGFLWFYDVMLRYLRAFTGKPIILQEFGYIGAGKPKTKQHRREVLRRYGVESQREAYANIAAFVEKLPQTMREHVRHVSPQESHQGDFLFKSDFRNHLFSELTKTTVIPGYPHTPEGQARFFSKILPRFYRMPFMGGAFIYCYADSERCYICSQADCPTETRWGLTDCNGKEKPSYYAVQKAFGSILKEEATE